MAHEILQILSALEEGDPAAAEQLLPLVYEELRQLAGARMAQESPGHTLQATALVHEAYARLVSGASGAPLQFDGRGHFFAAAAEAMRRVLVDRARAKGAIKRGGGRPTLGLDATLEQVEAAPAEFLGLHEALDKLAVHDPLKAQLVTLRFFSGLELKEAAASLGLSPSAADRHWAYARAWLYAAMSDESGTAS